MTPEQLHDRLQELREGRAPLPMTKDLSAPDRPGPDTSLRMLRGSSRTVGAGKTLPQHLQALTTANKNRLAQAAIKREVRTRPRREAMLYLAEYLEGPVEASVSVLKVGVLVKQIHRMYSQTMYGMLLAAGIASEHRAIGALTTRQREALASALRLMAACPRGDQSTLRKGALR